MEGFVPEYEDSDSIFAYIIGSGKTEDRIFWLPANYGKETCEIPLKRELIKVLISNIGEEDVIERRQKKAGKIKLNSLSGCGPGNKRMRDCGTTTGER